MQAHTLERGDRWLGFLAVLIPGNIRHHFLADLLKDREEMRARGVSRVWTNLRSAWEIVNGVVQRVPLAPEPHGAPDTPAAAEHAATAGWLAWRLCGPALFLGYMVGPAAVFWVGVTMLGVAVAALVTVACLSDNLSELQTKLANGVLGGTVVILGFTLVFGVLTVALLALASVFSSVLLGSVAVKALVFVATASACGITASGWVPEEWYPKRLVKN
jgi:hypothetical protein